MLKNLEKGSESCFRNFREALKQSGQGHLVNAMDAKVHRHACNSDKTRQKLSDEASAECTPVSCMESLSESTAETAVKRRLDEYSTEGTGNMSTERVTECAQGFLSFYC